MSSPFPRRSLGSGGLEVSALGLGCMGMSAFYGPSDEATNLSVIQGALDRGVTLLDTSDMYGNGANERLLAQVLATRRNDVVLATKFGIIRGPDGERRGVNGHPDYVRQACEASLQRLGVDHIDLYYQHRVDQTVPIEDTVGAMADLVKAGKVRYLGLSEASPANLRKAASVHPIAALQSEYSLWTRDMEAEVLPTCRALGIGFVAYSPLGRGFLTGAIASPATLDSGDFRRGNPRFSDDNFEQNFRLVTQVRAIAEQLQATPAQVALAWLLRQGRDIVPIPGTRSLSRLEENLAATRLQLSSEALARLDAALASVTIVGDRYPAAAMMSIDR